VKQRGRIEVKLSRRLVIFLFCLCVTCLAGILFWPFILNEIITPVSMVVWLLLRLLVLSIDQKYYWGAIILAVLFFLIRFLPQDKPAVESGELQNTNATIRTIDYWRSLFTLTENDLRDEKALKQELARLLLALYAAKQHTSANFGLYEALQRGEIPIPEQIHTFLFWEEPQAARPPLKRFLQSVGNAPRKWIRRWTGEESAEHYRMIDEVLCFIETSLEMKNEN
jgi:hypothetical protein